MAHELADHWLKQFEAFGARWQHNGDMALPHAELTSGLHSDSYLNLTIAIQRARLVSPIANSLLQGLGNNYQSFDRIVGPAYGGIALAFAIAVACDCKFGFTEKVNGQMQLARFTIRPGETILVVEDALTTGGTTLETIEALQQAQANVVPDICVIINYLLEDQLKGFHINSLIDLPIQTWPADQCPLCAQGSQPLRPKDNWGKFQATT
jgi:orotate phosphoribosyltransferase